MSLYQPFKLFKKKRGDAIKAFKLGCGIRKLHNNLKVKIRHRTCVNFLEALFFFFCQSVINENKYLFFYTMTKVADESDE